MFTGLIQHRGTLLAHERGVTKARLRISAPVEVIALLQLGDSVAVNGVCLTALDLRPYSNHDEASNGRAGEAPKLASNLASQSAAEFAAQVHDSPPSADTSSPSGDKLGSFSADLAHETIARTTLGNLRVGSPVNLELPIPAGAPLGGHIVQGHVDGVGQVLALECLSGAGDGDWWLKVSLPAELAQYVVEKGSIALDGISLTIARVEPNPRAVGFEPNRRVEPATSNHRNAEVVGNVAGEPNYAEARNVPRVMIGVAILPHTYRSTNLHTLRAGDPINVEVDVLAKYAAQANPRNSSAAASERSSAPSPPSEKFELTIEYLLANGY